MNYFTTLDLLNNAPAPAQENNKSGLTLLDLKSDALCSPSDSFFTSQEYSLINMPSEFFRRGKVSKREALAHELIFRCLSLKALVLQDVLPVLQAFTSSEWVPDLHHPAWPVLRDPNPDNTFGDLLAFLAVCEDVFATIYLEKIYSRTGGVVGLAPLDPRTVFERGKPGAVAFPTFWNSDGNFRRQDIDYYVIEEGGPMRTLDVEDVVAIKSFDVRSPLAGMSAVDAALKSVGLGSSLSRYIDSYLTSGGPSGLLKIKNRTLTEEDARDIQERWTNRHKIKVAESAKVAVLDEDADFQEIGSHLDKLGNESLRMAEQSAICTALGVPGQLVQAYYAIRFGNQRAGQEVVLKQFWEMTLSPTLSRYRAQLDKYFLVDFDGKKAGILTRVFWDLSNVKALQEDIDKKATRARSDYGSGIISINEARAAQGLKPVAGGDEIPALAKQEAATLALEQQRNGSGDPQDETGKKPQLTGKKDDDGETESKAYQWNGLELSRKPTALEEKSLQDIAEAQNRALALISASLQSAREELIVQALDLLDAFDKEFALALSLSAARLDSLKAQLSFAYWNAVKTTNPDRAKSLTANAAELLERVFDALLASFSSLLKSRILDAASLASMRGLNKAGIKQAVSAAMMKESSAGYDALAAGAAFLLVAEGRKAGAIERGGIRETYYSAILDKNTCQPCKDADGKTAAKPQDLPPVPNRKCEGRWRCRCCHVYVHDDEV